MNCEDAGFETRADGFEHCRYCGSLTLDEATRQLSTLGTHYGGSDWKYGYPHKFYIGDGKFYLRHAALATNEQIERWNAAADKTVRVRLVRDEEGFIMWNCPKSECPYGFQASGEVGL